MNARQIAFIVCVDNEIVYAECKYYLDRLLLPEGFEKDIITIREAPSLSVGYQAGMQSSEAKYKVFITQDSFLVNRNFIADIINVFALDEQIGLIGVFGIGKKIDRGFYWEVPSIDDSLMAIQYNLPWRENANEGEDSFDNQKHLYFRQSEYKIAVPFQQNRWLYRGNTEDILEMVYTGLRQNYRNYRLYYILGRYLKNQNINQAFLCMENAEFYCTDAADKKQIRNEKEKLTREKGYMVRSVAIVILSYNLKQICIRCIESIRKNNLPGCYKMIVVDNASSDGICEWLKEQNDIKLICNTENLGYPVGCNQGIKYAGNHDILLLNNDIEVQPNTIFCLRMGLYETIQVGAAGCVTNYAGNGQAVYKDGYTLEDWRNYAKITNIPNENPYERKLYLGGFALLLRYGLLEQIGMFDERFSPGYYEDNDLGLRIAQAGYQQLLCKNSFVIHYGSASFQSKDKILQLAVNKQKITDKWGFDIDYYSGIREELIEMIEAEHDTPIRVLEIGCGLGTTLARIKAIWPKAIVKGIEIETDIAQIGKSLVDVCQGDIETMNLSYKREYFDYIILGDVLEHLRNPWEVLERLKLWLKKDGCVIASIPNIMHMSVILGLLKGTIQYQEAGILDKTHLRFFTRKTVFDLFERAGFQVVEMSGLLDKRCWEEERELIENILKLPGIADEASFEISQYLLKAVNI